jgi:hypothetical protein
MSVIDYDVVLRAEVRAGSEAAALAQIAAYIREHGLPSPGLRHGSEVIRDDAQAGGRDDRSREVNGFVLLDGHEKHALLAGVAAALEAAGRGDADTGARLLAQLAARFRYGARPPAESPP